MRNKMLFVLFVSVASIVFIGSDIFVEDIAIPRTTDVSPYVVEDTIIMQSIYYYRNVYTMYDSVVAGCIYGEVCLLPDEGQGETDSLTIQWGDLFRGQGIDTSAAFIHSLSKSQPFAISSNSTMSLFRAVVMDYADTSSSYTLPDTTTWSLELWNYHTDAKIATIDSVGICKAINIPKSDFPETYGLLNEDWGFETFNIYLGNYAGITDSAYLRIVIRNFMVGQDQYCNLHDVGRVNSKFSESIPLSKRSIPYASASKDIDPIIIEVFPNPVKSEFFSTRLDLTSGRTLDIGLYTVTGQLVKTLYRGSLRKGPNIITSPSEEIPSGSYFVLVKENNSKLLSRQIIITK